MPTTEAAILARVKAVCEGLAYTVTDDLDVTRQPNGAMDGVVTLSYASASPVGGFGFTEEARGTVLVSVVRTIDNDYATAKAAILADVRAIYIGIVQDGAVTSGEYAVEDGWSVTVDAPRGANYLIGRVRVPINFEAVLTAS